MVKLHCRSFPEKLLIPAFVFFFFLLYPPAWIRDSRRRSAGAAGGCILIRPRALERAGGLEAIRGEIIDDCALARAVKQQRRPGIALARHRQRERASLRVFGRHRTDDFPNGFQPVTPLRMVVVRHRARPGHRLPVACVVAVQAAGTAPVVLGALAWGLMALRLFSHRQVLRIAHRLGAYFAALGGLLRGRHRALRNQVLVRAGR